MAVRPWKALAMAFALILGLSCAQAQLAEKAANGRTVFLSAGCAACHGTEGQGTATAPAISPPPLALPDLIHYVRQPTGKMPPVSETMAPDSQLADIYEFLKSAAPKSSAADEWKGNVENGKKLFTTDGCYECHGRQGQGGGAAPRIGPPAISVAMAIRYIRQPTGQMPPYTVKVVSDQELADILAYLKSIPPPPPASSIPLLNE